MLRRAHAVSSTALAALLAAGSPAAAESTPVAPQALRLQPRAAARPATDPATTRIAAAPTSAGPWGETIETRLTALAAEARALAARRPSAAAATDTLLQQLEAIATDLHEDATIGIAVRELDTGASVFEWDGQRQLNPASNHKLLTATAALELLGEQYRFQTRVLRAGDTLVIVGEGDPSLQVSDLAALARRTAQATDLHTVRRIVVDDTAFSPQRFGPGYDPHGPGVSYMAPSGALSLQWNTVEIEVRGAPTGEPLDIRVSPACAHVEVRTTAKGGRGHVSAQTRADGDTTIVDVRGRLPAGARYEKRRRVTDPGLFAGTTFASLLVRHGAPALPVERGTASADARELAVHDSDPLPQVLESALAWSNNFTTEQVLRTLGWRMTGEPGDWHNGHLALERFWAAAGFASEDLRFINASGLSTEGRITAAALADLLAFAAREGSAASALWSVLPVAGREGTLRDRLRGSRGRVRAKTGTLDGASALSGVVEAKGGRRLGFSILVNGDVSTGRSRRVQDELVMALVEHGGVR